MGKWIAGVIVLAAFGVGAAMLGGRKDHGDAPDVPVEQFSQAVARPTPPPTPAAPPVASPPPIEPPPVAGSDGSDAAPAPTPPPPTPAPVIATPARPAAPVRRCTKAEFAAVYDVAVPAPGALRAALRNLRQCHESGAISDADFDRIQAALVAKL
jgi:hypothetical protein